MLAKRDFNTKYATTDDELHAIKHELAHVEHFLNNQQAFRAAEQREFSDIIRKRIQHLVGWRASENPVEFVAEIRVGILAGKQYPQRIMKLYALFGGV